MKCLKFPTKVCDLLTCHSKGKCLWHDDLQTNPKEPEAVQGNEGEKEVCQCISIIGLIKGPNGEKICKSCKKIRADHW